MAVTLTIDIEVNPGNAVRGVRKVKQAINRAFRDINTAAGATSKTLGGAITLPIVRGTFKARTAIQKLKGALVSLRTTAVATGAGIGASFKGIAGGPLGTITSKIAGVGKALATGLAIAAVTATGLAIRSFAAFDDAIVDVGARVSATADQLDQLREAALTMGKTTVFTATEAAQAMSVLAQSGLRTQEIMGGLPAIMKLAVVANKDLATSSDLVVRTQKQFGLSAAAIPKIVEVIGNITNDTAVNFDRFSEAMKFAGSAGALLNFGLTKTAALVSLVTERVGTGSVGGTQFRAVLLQIARASQTLGGKQTKLQKDLEAAGVSLKSVRDVLKKDDLVGLFDILAKSQLSAGAAAEIFGNRAAGFVTVLRGGTKALQDRIKVAEQSGKVDDIVAQKLTSLGNVFKLLTSFINVTAIQIGQKLKPELVSLITLSDNGKAAIQSFADVIGDELKVALGSNNINTDSAVDAIFEFATALAVVTDVIRGFVNLVVIAFNTLRIVVTAVAQLIIIIVSGIFVLLLGLTVGVNKIMQTLVGAAQAAASVAKALGVPGAAAIEKKLRGIENGYRSTGEQAKAQIKAISDFNAELNVTATDQRAQSVKNIAAAAKGLTTDIGKTTEAVGKFRKKFESRREENLKALKAQNAELDKTKQIVNSIPDKKTVNIAAKLTTSGSGTGGPAALNRPAIAAQGIVPTKVAVAVENKLKVDPTFIIDPAEVGKQVAENMVEMVNTLLGLSRLQAAQKTREELEKSKQSAAADGLAAAD